MDPSYEEVERSVPASGLLGYLNFSQGKPDPRWQRQLNDAYRFFAERGVAQPWQALHDWLRTGLGTLQASGASAFRDVSQAAAVLSLTFTHVLPAYRAHHADLLFHLSERDLWQPFFLARVCEAVLAQGPSWEEQRIVSAVLVQLNDYVGHRPVAILETRPQGEPYEHERVRPIPLFIKGAGVAWGRYQELVVKALDILAATDPGLLADACFDPDLLDELALDPRAYDFGHPVNRRPNYVFGEWDPHHLDHQGRFRRYVARQVLLDALLERVEHPGALDRGECLFEAAAVLAGTLVMATGTSGSSVATHDSTTTLASLMPRIARYRDLFYTQLLARVGAAHGHRLREEAQTTRQPFGSARQHLNQYLARQRAEQLQQRHLALLFAEMGYPEASRAAAARIPAASMRLLSEILGRLATGHLCTERGAFAEAAQRLQEVESLLRRGIACGAFADPWNILGFQGFFPLFHAREDSVRDPRIDELVHGVEQTLNLYARLLSEAAAAGNQTLMAELLPSLRRLASWWDQFASVEVSDVRRVHGGEAASSAEHVAAALARWHEKGTATADLAFWRQHLEGFRSPKAFALVVDALLRKHDYRAALALLINWVGQVEQVPLEEGEHSFHVLALCWMLGISSSQVGLGNSVVTPRDAATFGLVRKFFDYLESNAEEYWQVPELQLEGPAAKEGDADDLYGAAYEEVTYRDSADDDQEGAVADGSTQERDFDLVREGERIARRLRFLATVARLWVIAARRSSDHGGQPEREEVVRMWLATAQSNQQKLLTLLDSLQAFALAEPSGSYDSLVEFDRRRLLKEQLLYTAVGTCLETTLTVGTLQGALGATASLPSAHPVAWGALALELEHALLHGDAAQARALLPGFLEQFRTEPLLFTALADGGQPRQILRVRLAQNVLRALAVNLPRLGLLRETYHLLRTALAMEQAQPPRGRGVTEFNHLFQAAYQAILESVVESVSSWESFSDEDLIKLLEPLTEPFLALWIEHSRTLQLSALEAIRNEEEWELLQAFVQQYGGDLFHAKFMTLANLRGVLHRGVGAYLDYVGENPDPLHPIRLLEDLGRTIARAQALRWMQCILQALVENYEEYKDYNTTTTQSDYGENLYMLLDFLRLKSSYERNAWQLRPLILAHEVLARQGKSEAAVLWAEACAEFTQQLAAEHQEELAELEQAHGLCVRTVTDRMEEKFVKPLALDQLCALIEPAMREAGQREQPAFHRLERGLEAYTTTPTGVGLDVPHWLRRLEGEVQRIRAARTATAVLAEDLFRIPKRLLSHDELQEQLRDWHNALA